MSSLILPPQPPAQTTHPTLDHIQYCPFSIISYIPRVPSPLSFLFLYTTTTIILSPHESFYSQFIPHYTHPRCLIPNSALVCKHTPHSHLCCCPHFLLTVLSPPIRHHAMYLFGLPLMKALDWAQTPGDCVTIDICLSISLASEVLNPSIHVHT